MVQLERGIHAVQVALRRDDRRDLRRREVGIRVRDDQLPFLVNLHDRGFFLGR